MMKKVPRLVLQPTQGWSKIMIMKYKQAVHYICFFLFSHYCFYIIFLIWSKSWNCSHWLLLFLIRIKFGAPKLVCPKLVYQCQKLPVWTPDSWQLEYLITWTFIIWNYFSYPPELSITSLYKNEPINQVPSP